MRYQDPKVSQAGDGLLLSGFLWDLFLSETHFTNNSI